MELHTDMSPKTPRFTARQPSGEGIAFSHVCPLVILSTERWVPAPAPPTPV